MSEEHTPLRLLANDQESLHVISAMLQDSIMPLTAMVYDDVNHTFSFLANRFCWELEEEIEDDETIYHRVHAGVALKGVTKVQKRNLNQTDEKRILYFLSLTAAPSDDNRVVLSLHFADECDIRIEANAIDIVFADIDHPWPTTKQPLHIHEYLEQMAAGQGMPVSKKL